MDVRTALTAVDESRIAGCQILVVEDDFNIAMAVARLLKGKAVKVIGPAATVPDALALIGNTERIDGAVLDIDLRGVVVYPVVDALRSNGVPVVFVTGYDEEHVISAYRDIPCVRKPVAIERLLDVIAGRR